MSGYSAFLVARLPDRIHYYRGSATVSGNTITYVCDESKLASVPGYTDEAYFEIVKDDFLAQTERFALDILRSAKEGQQPAQSWDNAIDDLIRRGETAATKGDTDAASAANTAKTNADTATNAANAATNAAKASKDSADQAAADARKAAEEARGSVSADRQFYFKRITDENGDTRPVLVDMTVS